MISIRVVMFLPAVVAICANSLHAEQCSSLTPESRSRIAAYVSSRYEFAPDLTIEDGGLVTDSCFRRIQIESPAPKRTLLLYLSPDQRFLSEFLLDTNLDPRGERRRIAGETEKALLADASPYKGPQNAPVTLIEFSDFQCPFCKRFSDNLAKATAVNDNVRIVFKHLPLSMHPWARQAALVSICANFQSNEAFWKAEEFFFSRQETINPQNMESAISAFAENTPGLDDTQMRSCLAGGTAAAVLARDEKLAETYHINATPTIFINGVRKVGVSTVDQLQGALRSQD